jgi:TPR repeat protein
MSRQYATPFGTLLNALLILLVVTATGGAAWAATFDDGRRAYRNGDYATALQIFHRLAERGNANAQDALGRMYDKGEGVAQDKAEASRWFQMADAERNGLTAYNKSDFATAMRIFRPLAERGQILAEYTIGMMYANGQGVPQDYAEALKWHRKAAEQGEPKAQFSVGVMYFKGLGTAKDPAEAFKWYLRAANQGEPTAQYNVAAMYAKGEAVARDPVTALMFYTLASVRNVKGVGPAKAQLEKSMSAEQIDEAMKRVYAWQAKPEQ